MQFYGLHKALHFVIVTCEPKNQYNKWYMVRQPPVTPTSFQLNDLQLHLLSDLTIPQILLGSLEVIWTSRAASYMLVKSQNVGQGTCVLYVLNQSGTLRIWYE